MNLRYTKLLGVVLLSYACTAATVFQAQAGTPPRFGRGGQPEDLCVGLGETAEFKVTVISTEPLSYQWRRDGSPITGQTEDVLMIADVQLDDAGGYDVVIANLYGSITSRVAVLTVDPLFTRVWQGPHVEDLGSSGYGAWADYDADGYPDLSVSRYRLGTPAIYHNNGDGTFSSLVEPFSPASDYQWFGFWGDWDSDGWVDLMAGTDTTSEIAFGAGEGHFTPTPLGQAAQWWGCASADYDRDGLLDLYFTSPNRLYRNLGGRVFVMMSAEEAGTLASMNTWGGACWGDINGDGWLDLYVPSFQASRSYMFVNEGNGRFSAVTNLVTTTSGPAINGAWGDYDNDDRLDLYVASFNGTSRLYRNTGGGTFEAAGDETNLNGSHNFAAWADFDNDGFLDLFVSGYMSGNKLFKNNGDGTFTRDVTTLIANRRAPNGAGSYKGAWFDYDNDGALDFYVLNGDDNAGIETANELYHNGGNDHAWLTVRLIGTVSNREAVGAKVRALASYANQARWQRRDISGGDLNNGNHRYAHFGLGDAGVVANLQIEWPSGISQEFKDVGVNQILTLTEPPRLIPQAAGGFQIQCWIHQAFDVECSTDLLTWTRGATVLNETGTLVFHDAEISQHACRYYRVTEAR